MGCLVPGLLNPTGASKQLDALKALQFREDVDFLNGLMDRIIADRKQKMQSGPVKHDLLNAMLTGVDKQTGERLMTAIFGTR